MEVSGMTTETIGMAVKVEQLEPQPVVSIRGKALVSALGETMGERFAELSHYLAANAVIAAGPAFVRYHTFEETETDVETGFPVVGAAPGDGRILAGALPGGSVISTWHDGPDHLLGEAYARIGAWLQEQDREAAGPGWEIYPWIDPRDAANASGPSASGARRIQLVQPLK
jgi:effector-binding domain-containing protein